MRENTADSQPAAGSEPVLTEDLDRIIQERRASEKELKENRRKFIASIHQRIDAGRDTLAFNKLVREATHFYEKSYTDNLVETEDWLLHLRQNTNQALLALQQQLQGVVGETEERVKAECEQTHAKEIEETRAGFQTQYTAQFQAEIAKRTLDLQKDFDKRILIIEEEFNQKEIEAEQTAQANKQAREVQVNQHLEAVQKDF